jgi:hypothetical protein
MKSFVAAIALTTVAFLTCGSPAKEGTGGNVHTPVLLLSEIGAHDPRIRVDPNAVPVARSTETPGSVAESP